MKKALFVFFVFIFNLSFAQNINTPLHSFFKKNADSTIVYSFDNYSSPNPYYLILSKKGDTISAFNYKAPKMIEEDRSELPFNIRYELFLRDKYGITKAPISINQYFSPIILKRDSLLILWKSVNKPSLWEIKDDLGDGGVGCPTIKNGKDISDGGGIMFQLITKQEIRKLHFYAPKFYENLCPGRVGRKVAIEAEKLFLHYLDE